MNPNTIKQDEVNRLKDILEYEKNLNLLLKQKEELMFILDQSKDEGYRALVDKQIDDINFCIKIFKREFESK
jgi:hypothetical protein